VTEAGPGLGWVFSKLGGWLMCELAAREVLSKLVPGVVMDARRRNADSGRAILPVPVSVGGL